MIYLKHKYGKGNYSHKTAEYKNVQYMYFQSNLRLFTMHDS